MQCLGDFSFLCVSQSGIIKLFKNRCWSSLLNKYGPGVKHFVLYLPQGCPHLFSRTSVVRAVTRGAWIQLPLLPASFPSIGALIRLKDTCAVSKTFAARCP